MPDNLALRMRPRTISEGDWSSIWLVKVKLFAVW